MGCSDCRSCSLGRKDGCFYEPEPCQDRGKTPGIIRVALVGSANVGKSVIFNHMTGKSQKIGNWAGKTVNLARGRLYHGGTKFELVDLPGTYSLSGRTEDEAVTFEYLASGEIDVVLNVVDSTALERNLYVTQQLLEMGLPVVVLLNKIDVARTKGITVDLAKLSKHLGVPVVEAIGITGEGLAEAMDMLRRASCRNSSPPHPAYGADIEPRAEQLAAMIGATIEGYTSRFLAMKLLEGHNLSARLTAGKDPAILEKANALQENISKKTGMDASEAVAAERYALARKWMADSVRQESQRRVHLADRLDSITTHPLAGYLILAMVMTGAFYAIFNIGTTISDLMMGIYDAGGQHAQTALGDGWAHTILWDGVAQGFIAAVAFVLPFILPFYIFLALLEDSGYLARVAVLMDAVMRRFGLHGKAFIPLILGYGCSVPAVLGTRILESRRERIIAGFLSSMVPCAARTVVIMALVGVFLGWHWALGFYLLNILVIFILGQAASRLVKGETYGLIMEVPRYHLPRPRLMLKQTWMRLKDFIMVAMPILVLGSVLLVILETTDLSGPVNALLSPLTVWVLGLPAAVGLILILGVFRKELTMVMLFSLVGALGFASVTDFMTSGQIIVFTLFVMFYIPCISALAAMLKEYGARATLEIATAQTVLAITIAGGANLLMMLAG